MLDDAIDNFARLPRDDCPAGHVTKVKQRFQTRDGCDGVLDSIRKVEALGSVKAIALQTTWRLLEWLHHSGRDDWSVGPRIHLGLV